MLSKEYKMIYITGDTHGNQYKWVEQIESVISPADIIIVCGDFGVGFWNGRYWSEETFYDFLSEQKYTVLFIDGNHENFDKLYSYPIETWCGGRVHKIRQNVIHLMRGEVYCIEDISIFVMGGGYSIDKYLRTEGVSWWSQEMPSEEEYNNALENLKRINYTVDYIITHTAPSETVYYLSTLRSLGIKNDVVQEQQLTIFSMKSNGRSHTNIGTLDISMLTWNYGETKQHYSVVFESWKPEKLLGSGILMKDKKR